MLLLRQARAQDHAAVSSGKELRVPQVPRLVGKLKTMEYKKRAIALGLLPYDGAQQYGDAHPIGTYIMTLSFERAKLLESHFHMITDNAPDGFTLSDIEAHGSGSDMSVACDNETDDGFITIKADYDSAYTMMVGPERVQEVTEFIEGCPDWTA